ncbi:hypothetical protein ERX46_07205 [Brumimicrobium glaciale]|uniref:Uncharacterized protein n=1 Tax=Brumimicrobium glaciale TaxID=200475 RepID=A0A4Q4KQJ3_9FLAO|nr:hypothetical protein [Brumimicrobium glaciale]RYM35157.1 hypothetical protein ERX46_07205 [Brumimicrobium glaciale]
MREESAGVIAKTEFPMIKMLGKERENRGKVKNSNSKRLITPYSKLFTILYLKWEKNIFFPFQIQNP